jgi:sugar phosphate isomerase/epimerase
MTALGLLQRAVYLGVGVVQIADNLPLQTLSDAEVDELDACAQADGLAIEVGTRGMAAENLERYLALAQRLGSRILRVVAGPDESDYDALRRSIGAILSACEDGGIVLAFENYELFQARELADFIASFGSDAIGICLDTTNSLGAGEGVREVVEALGPLTVNLHVKDFAVRRADHKLGFTVEGRPAGQGQMDIPWLLEQMRASGRDPNAIIELWPPPEPDVSMTIRKEAQWAEQSVRYMRTLISE